MELALEYMKVLLSWPVVAAAFGAAVLILFHEDIRTLMLRLNLVRLPGMEAQLQQQAVVEPPANAASDTDERKLNSLSLTPEDQEVVRQLFRTEQQATRLWEFRYLNYFFALGTQLVLNWVIARGGAVSTSAYEAYWMHRIFNSGERQAIIDALASHGLINVIGASIQPTEKGKEYATWTDRMCMHMPPPAAGPLRITLDMT